MAERKEVYNKKKEIIKLIMIILMIVIVSFGIYYLGFYTKKCSDKTCFYNSLVSCERAKWLNENEDAAWLYAIKGKTQENEGGCKVNINLIAVKRGKTDMGSMEGKDMDCYFPLGVLLVPEQNLESCHGVLKEDLQDLIIKRMHAYLLENLGEINEEIGNLTKVV